MKQADSVTIYYDASCRFCSTEILNLKLYDRDTNRMTLIDCSAEDFDDNPFAADHTTQNDMMSCLHIQDSQGRWYKGVEAFELMYRMAGFNRIANLCGNPITKPLAMRAYPWIVRNRYLLSKLGVPRLLQLWGWFAAKSADRRSRSCQKGQCSTEIIGEK